MTLAAVVNQWSEWREKYGKLPKPLREVVAMFLDVKAEEGHKGRPGRNPKT